MTSGERPAVLLHVQQFRGTGHRVRISRLATALHDHFRVVMLDGGPPDPPPRVPPGVEWRQLEPLFRDADRRIRTLRPGLTTQEALAQRRDVMISAVREVRPAALLLEFYPFARSLLASEIEAGIGWAKAFGALVVSSLRDIPMSLFEHGSRETQRQRIQDRLAGIDALLVHADPALLYRSPDLSWLDGIGKPIVTTGIVAPPPPASRPRTGLVVSMGGGVDGLSLGLAALEAWTMLGRDDLAGEPMHLFGGPYLPVGHRGQLVARCAEAGVTWHDYAPGFVECLAGARISLSRAGYNTVADVLASGVRSVLSPTLVNDQAARARLLASTGHALETRDDAGEIVAAVRAAINREAPTSSVRLDGVETTARWLASRIAAR